MTYGDIYEEFLLKCNCVEDIEDYRPCNEMYGVPTISYAIVVWFKDKSKIIYISENAKIQDSKIKELLDQETKSLKTTTKASRKYNEQIYERITYTVLKGQRAKIRACADEMGISTNELIRRSISAYTGLNLPTVSELKGKS